MGKHLVVGVIGCVFVLSSLAVPAWGQSSAGSIDPLEYFREQYPIAFRRQAEVYLNGEYLFHVHWLRRNEEGRIRLLARWPLLRIDYLDLSDPSRIESCSLITRGMRFGLRRLDGEGAYVLTSQIRVPGAHEDTWQGETANGLAQQATNHGILPLVPLSFFGLPLEEYLLRWPHVRLVRAVWTEIYGYKAIRVDVEQNTGPPHGRFWFVPDLGWVPVRWERGRFYGPAEKRGKTVFQLVYGERVRGVGIVKEAREAKVYPGMPPYSEPVVWEAEMLSYKLQPPPEREFSLAVFGIPEPSAARYHSRLWLWTLLGALGTLTALFLLRLLATRRRESQAASQA